MQNFRFKYQNIENIKETVVKNTEKDYAMILKKIDDKLSEIKEIEKLVEESYNIKSKLSPKELVFLNNYRETLKNKIKRKNNELRELELQKKNKLKELTLQHQEHKIFERLHEKQQADHLVSERRVEQKHNDEIANQTFNRKEN